MSATNDGVVRNYSMRDNCSIRRHVARVFCQLLYNRDMLCLNLHSPYPLNTWLRGIPYSKTYTIVHGH